ncbi:MAG: hypothetical protein A4S14_12750 [Proteobacteria bacterium SG_bin9]|nr:MAG: hypothetical protein A4S14_12750 [Proteobacteria bacterium SG_bin9]
MRRLLVTGAAAILVALPASAQDVPGIEICTVEKTMERRTSCLQSNVDFLKKSLDKAQLDNRTRDDAAARQIEALRLALVSLQKTIADLQAEVEKLKKPASPAPTTGTTPAAPASPAPAK